MLLQTYFLQKTIAWCVRATLLLFRFLVFSACFLLFGFYLFLKKKRG